MATEDKKKTSLIPAVTAIAPATVKETSEQKSAKKAAKLMEIAAPRIERAIRSLSFVGNLGRYNPTGPQIKALKSAIDAAYKNCFNQLDGGKATPAFQLPDATVTDEAKS